MTQQRFNHNLIFNHFPERDKISKPDNFILYLEQNCSFPKNTTVEFFLTPVTNLPSTS